MARFSVKYNFWDKNCVFTLWVEETSEGDIVTLPPLWPSAYKLTGKDDGSSWEEDGVAGISPDATEERERQRYRKQRVNKGAMQGGGIRMTRGGGTVLLAPLAFSLFSWGLVTVCMRVSGHEQINWAVRLAGRARSLKQLHKDAAYTDELNQRCFIETTLVLVQACTPMQHLLYRSYRSWIGLSMFTRNTKPLRRPLIKDGGSPASLTHLITTNCPKYRRRYDS